MLTRRDFLLRSLPSAIFLAFAPSLSARIDDVVEGSVVADKDVDLDPLEMVKTLLEVGLAQIPYLGGILSSLVGFFWPSNKADVWGEIRKNVEVMIDQKINDAVYSLLKSKLEGISNTLKLYLSAVATGDNINLRMQFIATNTLMTATASEFKNSNFQWEIGPLFAIFSQLHTALLRDCVLHGKDWGWSSATYETYVKFAGETIAAYIAYLGGVVKREEESLKLAAPATPGRHHIDIYNYWQPFRLKQQLLFHDYILLLAALDPIENPDPVKIIPFKDVYSRAYGTADNFDSSCKDWAGDITTPFGKPIANISEINVELFNATPRIVDVIYPSGAGPLVWDDDATSRMDRVGIIAGYLGGVEKYTVHVPSPTDGKTFNIDGAFVRAGSIPTALYLVIDGKFLIIWDRQDLGGDSFNVAVPGRKLTTLAMWTRSSFYDRDLGCMILGFSRDPTDIPHSVKEIFYVSAIQQVSVVRPRYLPVTVSQELQSKRERFWRDVMDTKPI